MNTRSHIARRPFTLPETLFAVLIGGMVMALVFAFLSPALRQWRRALAEWNLDAQSRLLRERLLRGTSGYGYGLREAERDSITVSEGTHETLQWLEFRSDSGEAPTPDSSADRATCQIVDDGHHALQAQIEESGATSTVPLHRPPVVCESMAYSLERKRMHATYTLAITVSGERLSRTQHLHVPLVNR